MLLLYSFEIIYNKSVCYTIRTFQRSNVLCLSVRVTMKTSYAKENYINKVVEFIK